MMLSQGKFKLTKKTEKKNFRVRGDQQKLKRGSEKELHCPPSERATNGHFRV